MKTMIDFYKDNGETFESFKSHGFEPGAIIEYKIKGENYPRFGTFKNFEIFNKEPIMLLGQRGEYLKEIECVKVRSMPWAFWSCGLIKDNASLYVAQGEHGIIYTSPDLGIHIYDVIYYTPFWVSV